MSKVLCIDLDGTLLHTDSLHEALFNFMKANPLRFFLILWWLMQGRAYLKQKVAERTHVDVQTLPYNHELLDWLKALKEKGRQIILVTAAHQSIADKIAPHLALFDDVIASDGRTNLSAHHKAAELTRRYGFKQYDYAGNSKADLAVWRESNQAIVVNASPRLVRRAEKIAPIGKLFPRRPLTLRVFLKAIRVHQYTKNVLLFIPLFAGHLLMNVQAVTSTLLGFLCFCLMASSVYLLNDLLDVTSDRKHPTKSKRAIASGLLSMTKASCLCLIFFAVAMGLTWFLPSSFKLVLLTYYALTLLYSFKLKQIVLVDVLMLSILYTIRIVAGMSLITMGEYSLWMLLFSMFLFLSLAFLKRVSELYLLDKNGLKQIVGRDYYTADMTTFSVFGMASGFIAVLVFALYLNSDAALLLYHHTQVLLLVFPFMLYWLCRIWLLATQGKIHEDPVLYTIRDKTSYYVGFFILIIFFLASI